MEFYKKLGAWTVWTANYYENKLDISSIIVYTLNMRKTFWNIASYAQIHNNTIGTIELISDSTIDDYGGACSTRVDWLITGFAAKIKIEVKKDIPQYQQIAMLYHELGHANCHKNKCKCFTPAKQNRVLSEIHAHRYTLEHLLKNKYHKALEWYVYQIVRISTSQNSCLYVRQAAQTIMRNKLYETCKGKMPR